MILYHKIAGLQAFLGLKQILSDVHIMHHIFQIALIRTFGHIWKLRKKSRKIAKKGKNGLDK